MLTPHPVYEMKRRIYERPIYAGNINAKALPITPISPPSEPSIPTEVQMRLIQASNRIYPNQPKSVYIPPTPADVTGISPTNPDILENINMRQRKWYPEPYYPYKGWPRVRLESGINV